MSDRHITLHLMTVIVRRRVIFAQFPVERATFEQSVLAVYYAAFLSPVAPPWNRLGLHVKGQVSVTLVPFFRVTSGTLCVCFYPLDVVLAIFSSFIPFHVARPPFRFPVPRVPAFWRRKLDAAVAKPLFFPATSDRSFRRSFVALLTQGLAFQLAAGRILGFHPPQIFCALLLLLLFVFLRGRRFSLMFYVWFTVIFKLNPIHYYNTPM